LGSVNVELFPLKVGELSKAKGGPPVQGADGVVSWHSDQVTVPLGAPPWALPVTVAVSPQALPTEVSVGKRTVVVNPGVAAVTLRHSAGSAVSEMLSLDVA
jgi:hypothetical protein